MKTILTAVLVDMAKGINPKTQNLLDKNTGTILTADGEGVVHTTIAIMSKKRVDDVVVLTNKVGDYKRPQLNGFALMDYSHRVAASTDKAKAGVYLLDTDAKFEYDEEKLLAPSVYMEHLNLFLSKCGFKETCDTQVTKAIRTWAEVAYVLNKESVITEVEDEETGKVEFVKTFKDELMLVEGATPTEQALLEAQLLKLRPKFSVELFADYNGKLYQSDEIILWAKKSVNQNSLVQTNSGQQN